MAHYQQLKFVEILSEFFQWKNKTDFHILEIGSTNVNGTIRDFLPQANYIGVDLCGGAGVDLVDYGHSLSFEDSSFHLSVACEVFEHDLHWKETFQNMYRMTKPGGYVLMTCATLGRLEHGTTRTNPNDSPGTQSIQWDYYHNISKLEFATFLKAEKFDFSFIYCEVNKYSRDLYFLGKKRSNTLQGCEDVLPEGFEAQLKPVFQKDPELGSDWSLKIKIKMAVIEAPIIMARVFLPEQAFQEFCVKYAPIKKKLVQLRFPGRFFRK